jgi:hypothetical protein
MTRIITLDEDRLLKIEASSIVSGLVDASGNLILKNKAGASIPAGAVKGDQGVTGAQGPQGNVGPQGAQGPIGLTGAKGDTATVGMIMLMAGTGPPPDVGTGISRGWLICDGAAKWSDSTDAKNIPLFNLIGQMYGKGAVDNSFCTPNLTNKLMSGTTPMNYWIKL